VRHRDHVLRRVSLLLLGVWVVVLGASFAHRQMQRGGAAVEAEPTPAAQSGEERPVRLHSGLVYTDTIGIEPNFRVAARETLEFASGWYELKDVEVSIYHAGEVAYGLVASDARYNPQRREAHVRGNAQLSLSKGVALRADGFELRGSDRSFSSLGAVTFAAAGWGGVGGAVSGNAAENIIALTDNVTATWRGAGGASLVVLTPRLTYNRRRSVILLEDGLTLLYRQNQLVAGAAQVRLRGAEGPPEAVALTGGVAITARLADGSVVDLGGGEVELRLGEAGAIDVTIHPQGSSGWVTASWAGREAALRTLRAWRVVGGGSEASGLQWLEGQGLVCVTDLEPGSNVPRQLTADTLRFEVAGNRAETATAWGNVRLQTGPQWSEGERLVVTLATGRSVLLPAPRGRVRFGSESLEGRADRIETDPERGVIAEGAVSGTVVGGSLLGRSEGPVQFAAARAVWGRDGDQLALEGDARLWQGERLIRADHLEHRVADQVVVGRGNVVTVGPAPRRDAGDGEALVRIAARALTYEAPTMIAVFEGDVRLSDEQAEVGAQRLTATFAPGGGLLLATFDGGLSIKERRSGRAVSGQRARLVPDQDVVEIWGNPVVVTEPSGNQMKAAHLVWKRRDGVLSAAGGADSRSEALYHPEQPLATPRSSRRSPGRTPSTQ